MKKQWIAEAVYFLATLVFIGICIASGKEPEKEVFGTNVTATPTAVPVKEEAPANRPEANDQKPEEDDRESETDDREPGADGQETVTDVTSAPVKDTVPTPEAGLTQAPTSGLTQEPILDAERIKNEDYDQYSNDKKAWWFQRNTKHKPSGSGEEFPIGPYSAYYVDKNVTEEDKVIYLTFDCGYENGFTPVILDTLAGKNVKAMFFVTKDFIVKNPTYVKRMKEEGHLVGNHTVRHLSSPDLTPEELEAELSEVARTMEDLTGYPIDPFFRPPMGEYSERTLKVTQDMGYSSIFWSIAYYDYDVNDQPGKAYVTDHFATYHHNGAIVLMHNVSESNTQALGDVIDGLIKENYRFAALTELGE